jgi:cell division protein FtsB
MKPNSRRSAVERDRRRTRLITLTIGLVFGGVLATSFFFDEMGIPKYLNMADHADKLANDIQSLKAETTQLRQEAGRLERDPAKIEELARERLGLVKKGETVYQIVDDKKGNGPEATGHGRSVKP